MSLELDHLGSMDLYLGEKGTQGDMGGLAQVVAEQGVGQPVQLPLDLVDEDPNQPRREFDEEALQELAQTIALRGVRQPVSVRPHPQVPGRWMLNFGARRYRASRLAGKAQIPAFVDETADTYDQVIENEQREGLRPLDLALFVQQRLSLGESQADIARQLGKSRAYVTVATALIEAPDWLLAAYREGRCRGLRELYELRQLHTRLGDQVAQWASAQSEITRPELAAYKSAAMRAVESAEQGTAPRQGSERTGLPLVVPPCDTALGILVPGWDASVPTRNLEPTVGTSAASGALPMPTPSSTPPTPPTPPTPSPPAEAQRREMFSQHPTRLAVLAVVDGHEIELVLDRLPPDDEQVFVKSRAESSIWATPLELLDGLRVVRR
jgi:ParB/RepB/Spo0J family partition protein